jgi:hypothetical protein
VGVSHRCSVRALPSGSLFWIRLFILFKHVPCRSVFVRWAGGVCELQRWSVPADGIDRHDLYRLRRGDELGGCRVIVVRFMSILHRGHLLRRLQCISLPVLHGRPILPAFKLDKRSLCELRRWQVFDGWLGLHELPRRPIPDKYGRIDLCWRLSRRQVIGPIEHFKHGLLFLQCWFLCSSARISVLQLPFRHVPNRHGGLKLCQLRVKWRF